jgi:hypothetical protein
MEQGFAERFYSGTLDGSGVEPGNNLGALFSRGEQWPNPSNPDQVDIATGIHQGLREKNGIIHSESSAK